MQACGYVSLNVSQLKSTSAELNQGVNIKMTPWLNGGVALGRDWAVVGAIPCLDLATVTPNRQITPSKRFES